MSGIHDLAFGPVCRRCPAAQTANVRAGNLVQPEKLRV